jgi:hypothetical protein
MKFLNSFVPIVSLLGLISSPAGAQGTQQLSQSGWFSDDTRADGLGSEIAGTNLISDQLTADPEATAAGTAAHDADIRRQISFGAAPGVVPTGTHRGAVHLTIGNTGSGKSQISHRKDDGIGHAAGSDAFGPGMSLEYSWMGDGTASVTASLKFGVKTADFGSTGVSTRTGENAWDKVMIYEPGNLNGGTADGLWHTETVDFTTGKWWFFDRTAGASIIGTPMTLADMSTSATVVGSGPNTVADVYALITAPGAIITSVQLGVGSGNANASVYVNQLETSFYRAGEVTTFGEPVLECDQDVTNNVIFGSGNLNGSFTTDRNAGVEVALRGKLRFNDSNLPENTFNSNGDGTYTFNVGAPTGGAGWVATTTPKWAFEWSVNSDYDGSTGNKLADLTYELGMDVDPGPGTNYLAWDPITPNGAIPYDPPVVVPSYDHAMGDNSTGNGAGVGDTDPVNYAANLATYSLAQNAWNWEFFNEAPFDTFDPEVEGRYDFYLAAFDGGVEVARTTITVFVENLEQFDQDVTSNVIFGSGNANGSFTTSRGNGLEMALRGKLRFNDSNLPENTFNSNGDGTYTFQVGAPTGGAGWVSSTTPKWAFEWSVNTDYDGTSGKTIDAYTYELGMDVDPGPGTNYLAWDMLTSGASIPYDSPVPVPFYDHAFGDSSTANGGGASAGDEPTYLSYVSTYSMAQNAWNWEFFNESPFNTFDPNTPGRYEFYVAAFEGNVEVGRTSITVVVTDGPSLTLEADALQADQDCDTPGIQVAFDLHQRQLGTDATGYQAFLAFDESLMTFEPSLSSYSAGPYSTHIQAMSGAEVAPGELRLDGSVAFGGAGSSADAGLATLVFTVAECTPVALDFDLGQGFASELSYQGNAISTNLLNSGTVAADNTAPIIEPVPDITAPADASVGSGCESAVINFGLPAASDTCGDVTVECFPPSGTAFPAGQTTTVTCVATDETGNVSMTSFDVTITTTNLVQVDIQLVGVTEASVRCIHFVADNCAVVADVELPFDATGHFSGYIEIPCGVWTSLCAKDQQHTLWDTSPLVLSGDGTYYVASEQLDLAGGDTDDDGDVDINDVTFFMYQFGSLASAGGCPWDGTRDADFSNDGAVGSEDYTFMTASWLVQTECGCVTLLPSTGNGPGLRPTSRPVTTAWQSTVDFDGNGRLDYRDVRRFEQRHGLPRRLSDMVRDETPARRR